MNLRVAVVGGGPAGMMAAYAAAKAGHRVELFEQNEELGRKLLLTGGGRCNLTTTATEAVFLSRLIGSSRFIRPALSALSQADLMAFFESRGVRLKKEGDKIYPVSDSAREIRDTLADSLREAGVRVNLRTAVRQIIMDEGVVQGIRTTRFLPFDRVIVTTGGMSYTRTGSDGRLLATLHAVAQESWRPGIVPLITQNDYSDLRGISLPQVKVQVGKQSFEGELLFTHRGLSGPVILEASSHLTGGAFPIDIYLDFIPDVSPEQLSKLLEGPKKGQAARLAGLLPKRLLQYILGPFQETDWGNLPKAERQTLKDAFKRHRVSIVESAPLEQAMVSLGGVSLAQIQPRTMEHRDIRGLFFAGECLALSGPTGGYNLQIAFSSGYLAGRNT